MTNINFLRIANMHIEEGDYQGFLHYCTEDIIWNFVGKQVLKGKKEILQYMKENYFSPPEVTIQQFVEEGDQLVVLGTIQLASKAGEITTSSYCDVWTFSGGQLDYLSAYVIEN